MNVSMHKEFDLLKVGETCCYHVGDLASDRSRDKTLDKAADEAFRMSAAYHVSVNGLPAPQGTGELELKQKKVSEGAYMYLAKRVKKIA